MSAKRNHAAHSAMEKRLKSSGGLLFAYRTASKTPQRSANGKKNSIKGFSAHAPAKSNRKSAAIIRVVPQEGHSTPKTLRTRHGGRRIYKATSTAAAPKTAAKARLIRLCLSPLISRSPFKLNISIVLQKQNTVKRCKFVYLLHTLCKKCLHFQKNFLQFLWFVI